MRDTRKQISLTGKIGVDYRGSNPNHDVLDDQKDELTGGTGVWLGGASANIERALETLALAYDTFCPRNILTRFGERPSRDQYRNVNEYIFADTTYVTRSKLLLEDNISYTDLTGGLPVTGNLVVDYHGGRWVGKQDPTLCKSFDAARNGLTYNQIETIKHEVSNSSVLFIDPTLPPVGKYAVKAANDFNVMSVTDYGAKKWPQDKVKEGHLMDVLTRADTIIVPGEAVVKGMEDNVKDPDRLFETLKGDDFRAHTIIMSDNSYPVRFFHNGEEQSIPVEHAESKYMNGVGDTRDAAFLFYVTRGDDIETAVRKATAIASIKVQYPGQEWGAHIYEHVKNNSLFKDDLEVLSLAHQNRISSSDRDVTMYPGSTNG